MNIYQEHILDLYKHPNNFGTLENPTNKFHINNPLCGDDMTIQLKIEDNIIKEVKFSGQGCAISMASSSMLTDKIKGMSVKDINNIKNEDVIKMLQIPISHIRMKCALLCLDAVKGALNDKDKQI